MNMGRALSVAVLAAVAIVAACSSDEPTGPGTLSECTGDVVPAIGTGLEPVISWAPGCKLSLVLVEDSEGGGDVWGVEAAGNSIEPGLRYGEVPEGATELEPPALLESGKSYRLVLFRREDGSLVHAAIEVFTAQQRDSRAAW